MITHLGYIFQTFRDYLAANPYLFVTDGTFSWIKMILGQISIRDTNFINQKYAVSATGSILTFNNSVFRDTDVESAMLKISESDITMGNTSITNLTWRTTDDEMFYLVKAYIEMEELTYNSSNWRLVHSGLSQVHLKVSDNLKF